MLEVFIYFFFNYLSHMKVQLFFPYIQQVYGVMHVCELIDII